MARKLPLILLFSSLCLAGLSTCSNMEAVETGSRAEGNTTDPRLDYLCLVEDVDYLNSIKEIWPRVTQGYSFSEGVSNKRVDFYLNQFDRRQKYFNTIGLRSEKYLYYILEEVEKRDMPTEIALLAIIESGLDPFAYSHGRAAGMWQFIPSTARIFKLESDWWYEGRRDVVESTRAAMEYLDRLQGRFDGDWALALAAYNSGSGTVRNAIKKNKKLGKPTDYWHLDLPKETSGYVPKLIALAQVIKQPEKYEIKLRPILNAPYFAQVDPKGQIDLAQAADLAETPLTEIYQLNPGYNRWATDPKGKRKLLVPYEKEFIFEENINKLEDSERLAWKRYTIKSGDTLSTIAKKHYINTEFLSEVNQLRSNKIVVGKTLMIPKPLASSKAYALSQDQRQLALSQGKKKGRQKITYRVKENDSFWTISRKYDVGIRQLARWNGMAPGDTLRVNQKLNVWIKSGTAHEREIYRKVYYSVRSGESLSHIAAKFSVRINDIRKWNDLEKDKYLQPGQKLVLHVNVAK